MPYPRILAPVISPKKRDHLSRPVTRCFLDGDHCFSVDGFEALLEICTVGAFF